MIRPLSPITALLAGCALTALATTATAAPRALPGRFAVGTDVNRDPCTATRSWSYGKALLVEREQPFVVTCRGSAEQRAWIDVAQEKPPLAADVCGAAIQATIAGIGPATLRRCADARLAGDAIVIETPTYRLSAMQGALTPALSALRTIRTRDVSVSTAGLDQQLVASLAPPPAGARPPSVAATGLDVSSAVAQGLQAIYAGRNVEASRLLNDAVALFATATPLQRAELRLNAGLADSNIREFGAADAHFAAAAALMAQVPPSPARARLAAQAGAYRALNYNNQGKWQAVLDELAGARATATPLTDAATLAQINGGRASDLQLGVDTDRLNQIVLLAQQHVARSTALLRLGRPVEAEQALRDAKVQGVDVVEAALGSGDASGRLNWLRARLERQQARIRYARGDVAGALASFDCALATMHAVALPDAGCLFPDNAARRGTALAGPAIADAELERTAILARQPGVDRGAILAQYEQAVATLASQSEGGFVASPLLAPYLTMLVEDGQRGDARAAERFFAALQTVREPGIARELATLQAQVGNGATGGLVRERRELERRRGQLRYEIAALAPDAPRLPAAQAEANEVSARLDTVNAELARSGATAAVDDSAVTIAQLQTALQPGEAYWKLSPVGRQLFGTVVTREGPVVYAVDGDADAVSGLAEGVLKTARAMTDAEGRVRIRPFATALSYDLFRRVAGPAADKLRSANAVIVDSGSTMGALPAAILVTSPMGTAATAKTDYGTVPFLIRKAAVANALSPRAFLRVRSALTPSAAQQKLIGFGANALPPAPATAAVAETPIALAAACVMPYARWAEAMRFNAPIPVDEIRAGAVALGDPNAPIVTGDGFTNDAIIADSEQGKLAQYQIVHFATHGLPATPIPGMCETPLPPSLLTTVEPPAPGAPNRSNGLLSYIDVARLRLDANLVILSACDTAASVSTEAGRLAGQDESAPTLDGLVRAFIVAQARAVMATYWSVPARQGTEELIETFYQAGRDRGMGEALREAQIAVLNRSATSHPYFWGAFFLVGDGAKTMLTRPTTLASR